MPGCWKGTAACSEPMAAGQLEPASPPVGAGHRGEDQFVQPALPCRLGDAHRAAERGTDGAQAHRLVGARCSWQRVSMMVPCQGTPPPSEHATLSGQSLRSSGCTSAHHCRWWELSLAPCRTRSPAQLARGKAIEVAGGRLQSSHVDRHRPVVALICDHCAAARQNNNGKPSAGSRDTVLSASADGPGSANPRSSMAW